MSRRSEKRAKRAESQWADDLRWLLGAPQGRRIVANLIERSGIGKGSMTGNSQTFWLLGRREFMQEIVNDLRVADLAGFRKMEDERIAESDTAKLENEASDESEDY